MNKFLSIFLTSCFLIGFSFSGVETLQSEAQAQKKKSKRKNNLRARKSVKYKKNTEIDFDEADITGSVKTPFGTEIFSKDQDFEGGFVELRKQWHDHMVFSLSGLGL